MVKSVVESINAITLVTRDMARGVAFYDAIGFEVTFGGATSGFTTLKSGACFVNLTTDHAPPTLPFWGRVIFHVSNVDDVHARALAAGYRSDTEPRDATWGERYFHIRDPDGHELSFAKPIG